MKNLFESVICLLLGALMTGGLIWVITLASNFKGF
ncbi:MAG: hypothetical protein [Bacteriophage sp.]|nr:MAG: hypothetical protein [Bacteriophage sp.]